MKAAGRISPSCRRVQAPPGTIPAAPHARCARMDFSGAGKRGTAASSKNLAEDSAELKTLMIRIDSLNLSARCFNCLDRANIRHIGELVMMEESALKAIKNLGKKSYDEITEKLEELGYPVGTKLSDNMISLFEKKINKK